ncbi:hypothetical protein CR513_31959, partial [Mucuna pruriens]
MKWFANFEPVPTIFSKEDNENYSSEKNLLFLLLGFSWDYKIALQYEDKDIKVLTRQIKVKWWKKFNIELINKTRINEWLKNYNQSGYCISPQHLNKEAVRSRISGSAEEFEKTIQKAKSTQASSSQHCLEESDQSNPYIRNEDMFN